MGTIYLSILLLVLKRSERFKFVGNHLIVVVLNLTHMVLVVLGVVLPVVMEFFVKIKVNGWVVIQSFWVLVAVMWQSCGVSIKPQACEGGRISFAGSGTGIV